MKDGVGIEQVNTCYRSRTGVGLFQVHAETAGSDAFGAFFQRTSEDNGRTWSAPTVLFEPEQTPDGVVRLGESALFIDEDKDAVLHFYNHSLYPAGHFTGDVERCTRIFFRVSFDGGQTFSSGQQVIQKGYDSEHWASGVIYNQNSMPISFCAPIKTSRGRLILPVQRCPISSDFEHPFSMKWEAGCLIGRWAGRQIQWELGEFVSVPAHVSSRGLCEPAIAELADGALLMICRASNAGLRDAPGYMWWSVSRDGGRTWSAPAPLTYADGRPFFSPATGSRLIRHSKNGKLCWIGNIVPSNPDGNRPRYPLQIGEVDEHKRALIADTVLVIEDRREGDSPAVQFSNFRVYEDRETHQFALTMARFQERSEDDLNSPAYQYRIPVAG
jgi:hypothetical protein